MTARRARLAAASFALTALGTAASLGVPRIALAERVAVVAGRQPGAVSPPSSGPTLGPRALGDAFAAVSERIASGVVQIETVTRGAAGPDPVTPVAARRALGSGVVLSQDGAILTNDHVIESAISVSVRLADGRVLSARIAGRDPETDLAVLRVVADDLHPVKMADSDAARVGEWVVAIGSPFGLGHSVTAGVLSAKGRAASGSGEGFLQTDASISPGSSGGPLVNLDGLVVGISTMVAGQAGGVGFAVPSNVARRVADELLAHGQVERPYVGMELQDLTPDLAEALGATAASGALVSSVATGSPADKARVKPGDIILQSGGQRVEQARALLRDLLATRRQAPISLVVWRAGRMYRTDLVLVPRPPSSLRAKETWHASTGLGLTLRDQGEPTGAVGSLVADVAPGSPADRAGVRGGDLLVEADGQSRPLSVAVERAVRHGHLFARVRRGERFFYVALRDDALPRPTRATPK